MSKNASKNLLEILETPLVALICSSKNKHYGIYIEDMKLGNADFQEELIRIDTIFIPYKWFDSITACNEENLKEIKEKLEVS
ncbi:MULTISPECIES: hypothetical protein [Bacillus]|jgi:hypothetical protein|uniref:Uncharacterized protein n=1 Tax=Bacillus cereus (strain G9842) TaxID=405531 RepID=B7IZN6_BACC2|nr:MULTISPECIES: hypothetical protein [Bacillus]MBS9805871.1 hypothetical protein [Bacillus toyonensis]ACK98716.1 hypothetical protein BCG9842_A0043 [Bacillus cereus G9842]KUF34417.1 hypothetical protein AMR94_02130 [Bacillus sp. G3(2015)]MCU5508220.1 hypothetical protein [Bacillus cereus]MDA1951614.1 hypothetical protein [Bacillus cereus]